MFRRMLSGFLFCVAGVANAAGLMGAQTLRSHYVAIEPKLVASEFGGPLLLDSEQLPRRIEGEVFAVVQRPFDAVASTLADPDRWCDVLILHLNTKGCRHVVDGKGNRVEMRVGKKGPQPPEDASLLAFRWQGAQRRADYVSVQMECEDGPYDTRDYRFIAEAVPLDAGRTFIHMGYAFGWGSASSIAMSIYLATSGRSKVGFTRVNGEYAGGMRGVVERNTMRYYLALDAYLSWPGDQQADRRVATWFDATEKYPRQLHELDRDDYLSMKRDEIRRMR